MYPMPPAHSAAGGNLGLDDFDDGRLRQCAQVAQLVTLARDDLAHDATHDLGHS